jgi:hypothetical protein
VDAEGNYAPDDELVVLGYLDALVISIVRYEPYTLVLVVELVLLEGKLTIHACHYEVAVGGL